MTKNCSTRQDEPFEVGENGLSRTAQVDRNSVGGNGPVTLTDSEFATELLLAGVPHERVSILLRHSSIRITERHYSPWVRSRQEQLERDVRSTWTLSEPVAEVHLRYGAEALGLLIVRMLVGLAEREGFYLCLFRQAQ